MESAHRDTRDVLNSTYQHTSMNFLQKKSKPRNSTSSNFFSFLSCDQCGGPYTASHCHFRDSECHYCHKTYCIAKVCGSKRANARNSRSTSHQHTNLLTDNSAKKSVESSDESSYTLFQLGSSLTGTMYISYTTYSSL